ncbi:MAG: hypothetical protein ACLPM3_15130 [Terracidiphilus sp.]
MELILLATAAPVLMVATAFCAAHAGAQTSTLAPAAMPRIGIIDERFQSYNIEMVEVTGGRFWKPYASKAAESPAASNQPAGMNPSMFQYRPPINLANPRLRKLAAALGPVYLRVSGTWANTTYFQNSDDPAPTTPPKGFNGVLTRAQWKGVVDFSHAAKADLVTSFAISAGTRDAAGVWTPDQAHQIAEYTKSIGGSIAAAEFMNEPNIAEMGGAPKGYDAAAYARDVAVFRAFARKEIPGMLFLGPGSSGEGTLMTPSSMGTLSSENLLIATGPVFDAVSYHSYGAVSSRCGVFRAAATTSADAALSDEWLARSARIESFYSSLRDRFEPGKALWLTETAQAACGGDRWASTFLDSFRYLNQLGALAKRGVQVHMHNTLAASDYGLLDENTYQPRSNYWAALLWHKLMGTTVLDPGGSPAPNLHIYAHCLRNHPGGVTLLVISADRAQAQSLEIPTAAESYTLTAQNLQDTHVQLNGIELQLGAEDNLPELKGIATRSGHFVFAPASITFLAMPKAHNSSCRQL